jgi:hypothetical protein
MNHTDQPNKRLPNGKAKRPLRDFQLALTEQKRPSKMRPAAAKPIL